MGGNTLATIELGVMHPVTRVGRLIKFDVRLRTVL
jgi:hypothetical protein